MGYSDLSHPGSMSRDSNPDSPPHDGGSLSRRVGRPSGQRARGVAESAATGGAKTAAVDRFQVADIQDNPVVQRLEQGRVAMGSLLRSWIALNGWTYDDVTSIVESLSGGFPLLHGSQLSNLIRGKLEPKPRLFVGLDYLNKACAFEQKERNQLPSHLVEKLIGVRAIRSSPMGSAKPWKAGDFLNLFCGLEPMPTPWLDCHSLYSRRIYGLLENLANLTHELVKAKRDQLMPSRMTIVDCVPTRARAYAKEALSGDYLLSSEQFEELLPSYAEGFSRWLGAVVTPYKLLEAINKARPAQETPEELLHHFVNAETTLDGTKQPWTIELEIPATDEENWANHDGYFEALDATQSGVDYLGI